MMTVPFCFLAVLSLVTKPSTASYTRPAAASAASAAAARAVAFVSARSFQTRRSTAASTCTNEKNWSRGSTSRSSSSVDDDHHELPLDFPRREDVLVALAAVRRAAAMTNRLQPWTTSTPAASTTPSTGIADGIASIMKLDTSPVTIADLAAQAMVLRHIKQSFPADSFIAEESSQVLQDDQTLLGMVLAATGMDSADIMKQSIDLGKEYESWTSSLTNHRPPRVWCLDPIDGTKGFLRGKNEGGQYCIALALIEDGIPTVGVMACPNLPSNPSDFQYAWTKEEYEHSHDDSTMGRYSSTRGCIFVASKGGGTYQLPLFPPKQNSTRRASVRLHVTPSDARTPSEARFCLGVEKFSDALGQCAAMAKRLHGPAGVTADGQIINARRFDSMAKYGVMARAGAELYARLPKPGYQEWIWDHAAGLVVLTEAGGTITDTNGAAIDFSLGAKMSPNVKGVLASNGGVIHDALVKAFQQQEAERLQQERNAQQ